MVSPRASAVRDGRAAKAGLGPTLALTVALVFAGSLLMLSVAMLVAEPKPIPGLRLTQRQDAETAVYLAVFAVMLPLALVFGRRIANRVACGPQAAALPVLTGLLVIGLTFSVLLARALDHLYWGEGSAAVLVVVGVYTLISAMVLVRACRSRPWSGLLSISRAARVVWAAAAVLALGCLLTVTDLGSVSFVGLGFGMVVAGATVAVATRRRIPALTRHWGIAADVLITLLILLAIPDFVIFRPDAPDPSALDLYLQGVIQFHHDLLLGPANHVLGGGEMLVNTASQYGVGSILFLVAFFNVVPIGYGTFGLLDGVLTATMFLGGYLVLRMCGCSRPLAGSALAVAVIALVFNRTYAVGAIVQEGPFRFGMPMAVIVLLVSGARWPARARLTEAAAIAVVALSSMWAIEALAFTAATYVALICFQAYLVGSGDRLRWLGTRLGLVGAACVVAHLVFAGAVMLISGQLPDWGQYLAFLDTFLGDLGDITYDFSSWSPAFAVGAVYLASACALVVLLRSDRAFVGRERTALLALTGTTAYGAVFFSYFVDRSASHVLAYVSLPALLTVTLWLAILLRNRAELPRGTATGALAFSLCGALLVVAVAWSSIGSRVEDSALAHVPPGGESAREALARLKNFPAIDQRSVDGGRLLDRYMPGERQSLVLVRTRVANETLMRSGRANLLPLANGIEDSFVLNEKKPLVRAAIKELRPGRRLLLDDSMLEALAIVKVNPDSGLLKKFQGGTATTPVQVYALREIDRRFRLKPIVADDNGFVIVELGGRR